MAGVSDKVIILTSTEQELSIDEAINLYIGNEKNFIEAMHFQKKILDKLNRDLIYAWAKENKKLIEKIIKIQFESWPICTNDFTVLVVDLALIVKICKIYEEEKIEEIITKTFKKCLIGAIFPEEAILFDEVTNHGYFNFLHYQLFFKELLITHEDLALYRHLDSIFNSVDVIVGQSHIALEDYDIVKNRAIREICDYISNIFLLPNGKKELKDGKYDNQILKMSKIIIIHSIMGNDLEQNYKILLYNEFCDKEINNEKEFVEFIESSIQDEGERQEILKNKTRNYEIFLKEKKHFETLAKHLEAFDIFERNFSKFEILPQGTAFLDDEEKIGSTDINNNSFKTHVEVPIREVEPIKAEPVIDTKHPEHEKLDTEPPKTRENFADDEINKGLPDGETHEILSKEKIVQTFFGTSVDYLVFKKLTINIKSIFKENNYKKNAKINEAFQDLVVKIKKIKDSDFSEEEKETLIEQQIAKTAKVISEIAGKPNLFLRFYYLIIEILTNNGILKPKPLEEHLSKNKEAKEVLVKKIGDAYKKDDVNRTVLGEVAKKPDDMIKFGQSGAQAADFAPGK